MLFKFEENKIYHMPPFFGGDEFNPDLEARVNDVVGLNFTQTTDGDRLAEYLPDGFELLRPAELPVKATAPVMMIKGAIIMKPFAGHVLE